MARSLKLSRLRRLLDYDPTTGIFRWRVNGRGRFMRAGKRAGTINEAGYRQICIDRELYFAGRLAWLYMIGRWPRVKIDHANCRRADDRWSNLREADDSQNGANSKMKSKRIPFKGVSWHKIGARYVAQIKVNHRPIWLGSFDTPEEAHAAYVAAAKKHFGKYARAA